MSDDTMGVLGSGDVGKALGRGFAERGWAVTVGTRRPANLRAWAADTEGDVTLGSFADAAAAGDVAVLAVRGDAVPDVLAAAGPENFAGTLVLDATNPLDFSGDGPPHLLFGGTDSLGERVQSALPDASVVKCFNTVSNAQMVDPEFEAETPPMMVCGDDDDAKARTDDLLVELGWPGALDVGDVRSARYLEALVPLWVRVGAHFGTWNHAFAVVE
ncbi:MAG: NADPH-dependent F420 reductase [Haloplanus sp.]